MRLTNKQLAVGREILRAAVERSSLRAVAREVGISPPGLALILDGQGVRTDRVADAIRAWLEREVAAEPSLVDVETAASWCCSGLRSPLRERVVEAIVDKVRRAQEHQRKRDERMLKQEKK
jgi:hypothetical protein